MNFRWIHTLCGLLLLGFVVLPEPVVAQQKLDGLTLAEAIQVLEQADLRVFYSSQTIKPWMRVEASLATGTPRQQLTHILAPFSLQLRDGPKGTLLVVPIAEPDEKASQGSILGVVRAPGRGSLIPNIEINLVGPSLQRTTSADGRFSFSAVEPGDYRVEVRHPIYRWEATEQLTVAANQPTVALLELGAPAIAQLGRVVVGGSQYELLRTAGASHTILTSTLLENLPTVGDDPLRAVKRLPGVALGGLSAASNIRGGEVGETLVRFDGLRLVNPFHLRDFQSVFSTIDPRIVRSIDVYTGGFPVNYGDRMSGVIDVTSMSPPDALYHEVGVSFFNASVLTSGLFANGDGEWLASARRSNLDIWFDALNNLPGKPRYTDAFAKVSREFDNSLKLTGNVLLFNDDVQLNDSDFEELASAEYEDQYLWLRLDQGIGDNLTSATLLAYTKLDSLRQGSANKPGDSSGTVRDRREFTILSLQSDWLWAARDKLLVTFGWEFRKLEGRYSYADQANFEVLFDVSGASPNLTRQLDLQLAPKGSQVGVYSSARFKPSNNWTLEAGLRWDKQTLEPGQNQRLSPRLGVRYALSPDTSVRASWGRFYQSQGIDELQIQDGVTLYDAPQRADHTLLGLEHYLGANMDLRVELYDKRMSSLRPRYENLLNTFVLLPELRPDRIRVAPDTARAKGYEIHLSQNSGPLSWWISLARASVNDRINGVDIPRSWDQTKTVTAGLLWDGPAWTFSLGFSQRSGWPTTAVMLDTSGAVPTVRAPTRNQDQFKRFRSTDIRIARRFEFPKSKLQTFLEVDNVFGHANRCCTEYQFENDIIELERVNYFTPIPSLGFVWQF